MTTTATYEETAIVTTYTYTATVVTEQGESTATLTARQDLDCPRRRECQCPKCHSWMQMHWNINLQAYEPVHCTGCVLGLYDIVLQPAVVAEPAAPVVAEPVTTVEQISAGIEHMKDVLAAWDAACEEPTVTEVTQTVDAMIAVVDAALQAEPEQTTKTVALEKLTAKHFLAWLRKQARLFGRRSVVGYIGDHIDTPLEMWLKEVLAISGIFSVGSVDGFEYQGQRYYLSTEFEGMSICVLEGDLDELPECGWREITAWEMLRKAEEYLLPEYKLIDPQYTTPVIAQESTAPEPAVEAEPEQSTVEKFTFLPNEQRPLIHMVTTIDRPEYELKADQAFYLARSESLSRCAEQPVYHIVAWSYEQCRWVCPCGDPHRACCHTKLINQDCRARKLARAQQPTTIAQGHITCVGCGHPIWQGEAVICTAGEDMHPACSQGNIEQQEAA